MVAFERGTTGWNQFGSDPFEKEIVTSLESDMARSQLKLP
jgi:hypothetical protein